MTAVIFDMDGLLIDSEPLWQRAEIAAFAEVGLTLTSEMCRQTMGLKIDEMVQYWFDRHPWNNRPLKEIEFLVIHHLAHIIRDEGQLLPGAIELADRLKRRRVDMAIASSSPLSIIEAVVDRFELGKYFRLLRSAESQLHGKPHPGIFLDTAKDLGRLPRECLVFEDSINGVIAGKAAKMTTVAVPDKTMFGRAEFSIADLKISSLLEFNDRCFERFIRVD